MKWSELMEECRGFADKYDLNFEEESPTYFLVKFAYSEAYALAIKFSLQENNKVEVECIGGDDYNEEQYHLDWYEENDKIDVFKIWSDADKHMMKNMIAEVKDHYPMNVINAAADLEVNELGNWYEPNELKQALDIAVAKERNDN